MLTEDDRTKILAGRASPANPQYQVRLFCTSEAYYSPPYSSYPSWRPNTANCQPAGPAYVEFPAQSEVRVNGQLLSVNLRGIKKKEGSTMPPDLSKPPGTSPVPALNMGATYTNRAELVYTNSPEKVRSAG
jgi:E3 SUMO-protein ligase PIAS1